LQQSYDLAQPSVYDFLPHLLHNFDGVDVNIRPSLRLAANNVPKTELPEKEFVIGIPTVPREKVG
jgi:hypothetical protein